VSLVSVALVCVFVVIYAWAFYNIPILAAGIKNQHVTKKKISVAAEDTKLPSYSIIVPAKNEEKTIGRLLESLTHLCYPQDKLEIIVVEDGSTDRTYQIC
jgi:cellulose synthase/poly-beta-1,6-N-acetylglucosamine synthase-like glycosyltransferase